MTAPVVEQTHGSERDVQARFGLKAGTLRTWRSRGEGPAYIKVNRAVLYEFATVLAYLKDHEIDPANPT